MSGTVKVKAIIPPEEFEAIYKLLPESRICQDRWCAYSRTTCHVRELRDGIRAWWQKTNGIDAPGFSAYEKVFQNAIKAENKFYWLFWTNNMASCDIVHKELIAQVRKALKNEPIDTKYFRG